MSYRILEYSKEIIERTIDKERLKNKNYKIPVVYAIVIYTGNRKWNAEKEIEKRQEELPGIGRKGVAEYEIVDVNSYTEEELIRKEGILSKIMLIEKAKNQKELIEKIERIIRKKYTKEEEEILKRIIYYIFLPSLNEEKIKEIAEKLREKEEKGEMAVEELIRKSYDREFKRGKLEGRKLGRQEGRQEGKMQGKIQIVVELLKRNISEDFIIEISGITRKQIQEIKEKYIEKNK